MSVEWFLYFLRALKVEVSWIEWMGKVVGKRISISLRSGSFSPSRPRQRLGSLRSQIFFRSLISGYISMGALIMERIMRCRSIKEGLISRILRLFIYFHFNHLYPDLWGDFFKFAFAFDELHEWLKKRVIVLSSQTELKPVLLHFKSLISVMIPFLEHQAQSLSRDTVRLCLQQKSKACKQAGTDS